MSRQTTARTRPTGRVTMRTVRRGTVALAVLVVVALLALLAVHWILPMRERCADGVVKRGPLDECVGVSDGSFVFDEHLGPVMERIRKENERVADGGDDYVDVAYLTSFTLTGDDSNSEESVRRELEGAHLAQHRRNRGDQEAEPRIRLLVANTGSDARQWRHTAERLVELRDDPDHPLVAVAGLGPSTKRNKQMMAWLARHELAMVGSIITATDLNEIPGLVRVAPTNEDEAQAAAAYLKRKGKRTAVVVQDEAADNLYAHTLSKAFTRVFPDRGHRLLGGEPSLYHSRKGSWRGEMSMMGGPLCEQRPDVVYFAGRGRHLTHFLNALSERHCQDRKFTVMTGDDTTNLSRKELEQAAGRGIEVLYTGLAHPDMWRESPEAVSGPSAEYFAEGGLLDRWFPEDPRDDGQAIMGHDAVLTAIKGIQMAELTGPVNGEAVGRMFQQMDPPQFVPGASGFISFANNGDPRDKAVPILRLKPSGRAELVEVSAPEGKPLAGPGPRE